MFLPRTLPSHAPIRRSGSRALHAYVVAPPCRTHCTVSDTMAGPSTLPCMRASTTWSDAQRSGCSAMQRNCKRSGGHSSKNMALIAPLLKLLPGCCARGSQCSRPDPYEWLWFRCSGVSVWMRRWTLLQYRYYMCGQNEASASWPEQGQASMI